MVQRYFQAIALYPRFGTGIQKRMWPEVFLYLKKYLSSMIIRGYCNYNFSSIFTFAYLHKMSKYVRYSRRCWICNDLYWYGSRKWKVGSSSLYIAASLGSPFITLQSSMVAWPSLHCIGVLQCHSFWTVPQHTKATQLQSSCITSHHNAAVHCGELHYLKWCMFVFWTFSPGSHYYDLSCKFGLQSHMTSHIPCISMGAS